MTTARVPSIRFGAPNTLTFKSILERQKGELFAKLNAHTKMAKSAKITDFFNVKKTIEFVDVPIVDKDTTISNSFYKDCLTEKINQNKCDDNCEIRKIELKNLLQQEKIKLYNLEKALSSCLFIIDIKNDKISKLMEKTQTESTFNGAEITESVSKSTMNITTNVRTPQKSPKSPYRISADLFKSHENNFSAIQLAQLRSLGREMRSDSTFILRVMRFLYDDDITALKGTIDKMILC